jgi:uncharacterized protein with HEPN domain
MPTRDDSYLLDIFDSARFVVEFVAGVEREFFIGDRMRQSAIIRELAIIGEAVKKLSPEFKAAHPDIPWGEISGMRDILVHDYRGTNLGNVWYAATESVPSLITALEPLIPQNPEEESSSDDA